MVFTSLAAFWAAALAQTPADKQLKVIEDKDTGYSLPYPAEWEYRKERLYSMLTIPLSEGRKAEVQMVATPFRGQKDAWQKAQAEVAKTLNRSVEKQWEELILGVPLLMTRLAYLDGQQQTTTLVGLIYSRNPVKLSFRLTSPSEGSAEAEAKWRSVLNGIRTLNGQLPDTEDPSKAVEPAPSQGSKKDGPKITVFTAPEAKASKAPKGTKREDLDILGQPLAVTLPKGWSTAKDESGYRLVHPKLKGTVRLDFGAGQAVDMAKACAAASGVLNTRYQSVRLRIEKEIGSNRSGARMYQIERIGSTPEGHLAAYITGGHAGSYYWITIYTSEKEKEAKADKKLLDDLHEILLLGPRS